MTEKPLARIPWPWLFVAFLLGAILQGMFLFAQEPRSVHDAWQEGYESGYADATGEAYEPMPILPVLGVLGGVAVVALLIGVVKFVHHARKRAPPEEGVP